MRCFWLLGKDLWRLCSWQGRGYERPLTLVVVVELPEEPRPEVALLESGIQVP